MTWPGPVSPEEPLARLLFSSNWYSPAKRLVKQAAFLPDRNRQLSVCRNGGMEFAELWRVGDKDPSARTLHGAGIVKAGMVGETGLSVDPNNVPPRHAHIIGWPAQKDEQKSLALRLSSVAELVLRETAVGGS